MKFWMLFCLGTILCWGAYGPVLHTGTHGFGTADRANNSYRAMLCVGAAYFVIAVLIPIIVMTMSGKLGGFNMKGTGWSLFGGVLGALGATCIIMAFKNEGQPIVVMAVVFGCAPIVNALISTVSHGGWSAFTSIDWRVYLGTGLTGVGAYLVMAFKP